MKIRNSIFIIIMIVLVTTFVSTFYGIELSSQKITAEIIEKTESISHNTMYNISKLMFERQSDIKQLSDIRNPILHNPDITLESKIDYLRTIEKSNKAFTSISLYDKNGIKIGNTRNVGIGTDDSDKLFFISAMKDKHHIDSVPVFSSTLNLNIIHFSSPFYDENGIVNGIIMAEFPLNKITSLINQNEQLISETNFELVSNDGTVIFSKNKRELASSRSLNDVPAFNMIKNSQENVISIIDTEQDALFVIVSQSGYMDYAGNNWYLSVSIPSEIALQEVNNFRITSIIVTVATIMVSIIISILFSRSITKPIILLQESFVKIVAGDLQAISIPKGSDEIRELSKSFNMMTEYLKKNNELAKNEELLLKRQISDTHQRYILEKKLSESKTKLTSEKLFAAQKSEFTAMISHELKTPLFPIMMHCEMLKNPEMLGKLSAEQLKSVNEIESMANKLSVLTSDIFDANKLDMNQITFTKKKFKLCDFLNKIIINCKPFTVKKQISLTMSADDLEIYTDYDRLSQVFTNIITNSVDFTSADSGKIHIAAKSEDGDILFSVKDNGIGIDSQMLPHIFRKFYQVDATLKRKHGGTGLGLVICKGIVEGLGGKIWVDSKIDKGTTIFFTIPSDEVHDYTYGVRNSELKIDDDS
jgi:signal transduction histidine kinase